MKANRSIGVFVAAILWLLVTFVKLQTAVPSRDWSWWAALVLVPLFLGYFTWLHVRLWKAYEAARGTRAE